MKCLIFIDEMGVSCDGVAADSAAAALGQWAYANREALGIVVALATRQGEVVAPAQFVDGGVLTTTTRN